MDEQRFDRWARSIAAASSRRGLLKGLAGALAAGLFAAGTEEAAARSCRGNPDGTPCGGCGVCKNNTCVADPTFPCGGCLHCDPRSLTCRPNHDRCTECQTCERDGTCKNLRCTGDERCCNHQCVSKNFCCNNADCGECGRCEHRRCRNDPAKLGQKCGTGGCQVCTNHGCDNQIDNAGCFDRNGLCCDGVCCPAGQSCCGRTCCDGTCVADVCCSVGSFAAAEANLCCPFGPPCGEGPNARCCEQDQVCCDGTCEPRCGETCCPAGRQCCDGVCCAEGQQCCGGVCRTSCDDDCGAGNKSCEGRNGTFCCSENASCCPGNLFFKCGPDPDTGACCGLGTTQCGSICCADGTLCGTDAGFEICCPEGQHACGGVCCPPGKSCFPGPGGSRECRDCFSCPS